MRRAATLVLLLLAAGPAPAWASGGWQTPEPGATVEVSGGGSHLTWYPDGTHAVVADPVDVAAGGTVDATWHLPWRLRAVIGFQAFASISARGNPVSSFAAVPGSGWELALGADTRWVGLRLGTLGYGAGLGGQPTSPSARLIPVDAGVPSNGIPIAWRLRLGPVGPVSLVAGALDEMSPARFAPAHLGLHVRVAYVDAGLDLIYNGVWTGVPFHASGVSAFARLQLTPSIALTLQMRDEPDPHYRVGLATFGFAACAGVRVRFGADLASVGLLHR